MHNNHKQMNESSMDSYFSARLHKTVKLEFDIASKNKKATAFSIMSNEFQLKIKTSVLKNNLNIHFYII